MSVALKALPFREIWAVDFEFVAPPGEQPDPVCMVARELRSGRLLKLWRQELRALGAAPFDTGPGSLFVAYFASAEIGCFLALGWPVPERILDLFTEFRAETNGTQTIAGNSLVGALAHFGLSTASGEDKQSMRQLVMGGGPWDEGQRAAILKYCESDVLGLSRLLLEVAPRIADSPQRLGWALLRGRYMAAVGRMERNGIAIDVDTLRRLQANWQNLQGALIREIDSDFDVYDGPSFRAARFEKYLIGAGIPWPRLESGALALGDDVFRQQMKVYPLLAPLRELRHALSELRLNRLAVGSDGRNRTLLSPFRSKTGRNQPSNASFIFGPSVWLRGLIKPGPGQSMAYLDWQSQEIALAAALSGDDALWDGYATGDPYIAFAIRAGLAPAGATKKTHKQTRDRCKTVVLGLLYGMAAKSMAHNAGLHEAEARELLLRHRETYRCFWAWAEQNVNAGLLGATLYTRFGWPIRLGPGSTANTRSLLNWPMQANGAEMMRLACCEATESGLKICAPVHDALLLEAPTEAIDEHVWQLKCIMQKASALVLGHGRACDVDVEVVHSPGRYSDERGTVMWDRVMGLLSRVEADAF